MLEEKFYELLVLNSEFLEKRARFTDLKDFQDSLEIPYWGIVSGRPAGEVYHREVYIAFSEEVAQDCLEHILDEYEDWELGNWLWGPHVHERCGNPTDAKAWTGHREEPAPLWTVKLGL